MVSNRRSSLEGILDTSECISCPQPQKKSSERHFWSLQFPWRVLLNFSPMPPSKRSIGGGDRVANCPCWSGIGLQGKKRGFLLIVFCGIKKGVWATAFMFGYLFRRWGRFHNVIRVWINWGVSAALTDPSHSWATFGWRSTRCISSFPRNQPSKKVLILKDD